ncbi:hypothetical protein EDD16DRAFT_1581563 [Pisolithus croceorrhizus]|nr:hypothetical protein EDD16DRAFT_1581563 [Pisolithus croceorrhizus]
MSYPSELVPLLLCPLCSPPVFLVAPTTLRCGHTVCSTHASSSVCPVPTCSTAQYQGFTPSIPSSSRVEFFAAPHSEDVSATSLAQPRLDVRINNIIQLFRHARLGERDASSYSDDESDRDDSGTPDTRSRALIPRSQPRQPAQAFPLDSPRPINSVAEFDKALTAELTCEICLMLLYQPVTTPCQHTFCSKCLQKSLDHSILCPLCRQDLPGFAYFQEHPHNKVLLSLLLKAYTNDYASRGEAIENAERHARLDTPIFVCQLSFPGMPTLLHFFEPRYRLMLAAPLSGHGATAGTEFGTMHEIRSVQMLADGRSMVQTWGIYLEKIDDYDDDLGEWAGEEVRTPITLNLWSRSPRNVTRWSRSSPLHSSQQSQSTEALMAACHLFLSQLCEGTAPWVVQRLNHTYAKLLPVKSVRLRLRMVVGWIEQLNSNWWFSRGCIVL